MSGYDDWGGFDTDTKPCTSMKTAILPFIEENAVYEQINFSHNPMWGGITGGEGTNATVRRRLIKTFLCPSDQSPSANDNPSNYPNNMGVERYYTTWRHNGPGYTPSTWDGVLHVDTPIRMASITDGTSKTVVWSEWVRGPMADHPYRPNDVRIMYRMDTPNTFGGHLDPRVLDRMIDQCKNNSSAANYQGDWGWKGERWNWGEGMRGGGYKHTGTPNTNTCAYSDGTGRHRTTVNGVVTASSRHAGGVHVCYVDGSVEFVTDSVDRSLWWAMGTRALGADRQEPISGLP
jgi:prepilin-type processing-associated H-X9-DG protein